MAIVVIAVAPVATSSHVSPIVHCTAGMAACRAGRGPIRTGIPPRPSREGLAWRSVAVVTGGPAGVGESVIKSCFTLAAAVAGVACRHR